MSAVYKVTEIVGTSKTSIDDAIQHGIKRASKTLRNLGWFEVKEVRGSCKDGDVGEFQVIMKVGFRLDDE